jgi:hypothetical protein
MTATIIAGDGALLLKIGIGSLSAANRGRAGGLPILWAVNHARAWPGVMTIRKPKVRPASISTSSAR